MLQRPSYNPSPEVIERVRREARQGNYHQQYTLGLYYYYGLGLDADRDEALSNFRSSAQGDYVLGMLGLAFLLEEGAPSEVEAALSWFLRVGEAGKAEGFYRAATILFEGRAVWKMRDTDVTYRLNERGVNFREAYRLFIKSAERGFVPALDSLGLMCEYGAHSDSGEQDFRLAGEYYRRGCDWGISTEAVELRRRLSPKIEVGVSVGTSPDPEACYHLGLMKAYGRGMHQDFSKAVDLLVRANTLSEETLGVPHPPSSLLLGKLYANGQGVSPNYHTALAFFAAARDSGDIRVTEEASRLYTALDEQLLGAEEGVTATLKTLQEGLAEGKGL